MNRCWDSYIVASVAVGMTAGFVFMFFLPQQRKLGNLRASIRNTREQLHRNNANIADLPQIQASLQRTRSLLAECQTRIPETAKLGDFVEEVSAIAEHLRLGNQNIVPQAPERLGGITTLPIRISFDADFPELFSFLRAIESLPRATRVTRLAVLRPPAGEEVPVDEHNKLRTELTMQIFHEM
ncbi:MAG: type 4a pilus biogenesis protein PilO [Phycisphaerae bacterium]|nr:type 4a pilus biogenesis protein PilO [Phycisphaerae bacterium]